MNHTTKTLAIALGMLAVIAAALIGSVGILGYLQGKSRDKNIQSIYGYLVQWRNR